MELLRAIARRDVQSSELALAFVDSLGDDEPATAARASLVRGALERDEPTALDRTIDLCERVLAESDVEARVG